MRPRYKLFFPLVIVLLLIIAFAVGCAKKEPAQMILLNQYEDQNPEKQPHTKEKTIRVAVSSMTSAKQSIIYYDEMLKYIEKSLNVKVEIIQRKTYAEVNDLMKSGQVDLAFVCTSAFVKGHSDFGMKILAAPRFSGGMIYQSYIIAAKDREIDSFSDLKGKKFAFSDPMSTSGRIYTLFLLKNIGQSPESYFREYIYTYSHDNSIKAVYEGLVDGASVESLVFQYIVDRNPEYASRLKIIHKSPSYATPPVVVRPGIDPKLKDQLQNLFLNMHKDEKGNAILKNLSIDEFVLIDEKDYDSVRELLNVVNI